MYLVYQAKSILLKWTICINWSVIVCIFCIGYYQRGVAFTGVISFWVCITQLEFGYWNILIGDVIMFVLFGIQALVNRTEYVKKLKRKFDV